ncbi:MAG: hypothetical protein AAGE94_13395 [Acidobacteriota bacterium]
MFESETPEAAEGHTFEPELLGPVPRPIPEQVRDGRWARRQRQTMRWLVGIGATCGLIGSLPIVDAWSVYLLFLPFVFWIGAGLLALAAAIWLWDRFGPTPIRYIEHGVPLTATVVELATVAAQKSYGQVIQFRFQAAVEYRQPETGEPMRAEVVSSDFSSDHLDQFDVDFRVGDQVTMVYLPGEPDRSIQLYGFLDLMPGVGLVREEDPQRLRNTVLYVAAIATLVAVPLLSLWATALYWPLEEDLEALAWPFGLGVLLFGGALLAWFARTHRKVVREQDERNWEALRTGKATQVGSPSIFAQRGVLGRVYQVLAVGGIVVLSGLLGICVAITLNARLDDEPATEMAVEVVELFEETHVFLVRLYYVEIRHRDGAEAHDVYLHPAELEPYFFTNEAIARVRPGRYGWPWVESVEPVLPDASVESATSEPAADDPD